MARGLAPATWTDGTLTAGTSTIRPVHVQELRTALAAVYVAAGLTPPTFTDPTLTVDTTTVKAVHLQELRTARLALSGSSSTVQQFYHLDAIGSVRAVTDATGAVVRRHDYTPFGEELSPVSGLDTRRFAGKERDAETGFDFFSARYYAAGIGRFGSRDPISVNAVRMTDGQRWNAFSYAINNPLKYGDPDGRDALLVFYTQGAMLAGHVGVMALNRDGSGTYGGFNPVTKGKLWDQGDVDLHPIPPGFISLNSSGMPTTDSLDRLRRYLRGSRGDGKPSGSYFIKHIKTSDAQTLALSAYIARTNAQPWRYNVMWTNCLDFAYKGLSEAGIDVPKPRLLEAPNNYALRSFGLDFVRW